MRCGRLARESLAAVVLLLACPASAQSTWTIPGIVNAGGLNNTRFVSDVMMTNPGATATEVTISFVPSSTSNARTVTLNAGETLVYRNVVDSLFGTSGAGALSISSDQPLLLRARTYNTASGGTYGVALPVYPNDRLMSAGDRMDSLWISQDASGRSGYRTNIAVVFPDERGGAAIVTVFDAEGNERGKQDYALDTAGLQQFAVGGFAGAVSIGRAEIAVTRGRAGGYAVVVDNVTGDSSLFAFEDRPAGRQDVLVNGVARANGRNNAFFRTDGRFYNPTDTDATVQVAFHASGNSNPAPATASFTLPAGKIRDVVDVLDSLLGLPVGSAGALRFKSDWPVAILCRTSNVDPSGARQGTFGSQQKPVPVLSFLMSADAGAAITGMRQDAAFRTNVGFAAGGEGAVYTLTLTTAPGATVATTSGSLGSWGWTQPNIQDLFPGASIPADATLKVQVTQGSVDVYDSSIDNLSGDPVVTPIAPLPADIPSAATIGPAGGSIRSSDGRLTLKVPAGALSQPVAFSFQSTTNDAPQGMGPGYQLSPSGVTFARPALLTLAYVRADTDSSSAEALTIVRRNAAGWTIVGGGTVDPVRHSLTVPLLSSSPAPAARGQVRSSAAAGLGDLEVVRSWELQPSGRQTVFTKKQLKFSVYSVSESSSSSLGDFLNGPILSNSPYEVKADWYANDVPYGDTENGYIAPETGTLSALYQAPNCAPHENPVRIDAVIINRTGFKMPYRPSGLAQVRVVPRDWKLKIAPHFFIVCAVNKNPFSDEVKWVEGMEVDFSLQDDFHTQTNFLLPAPSSHARSACPVCPGGKLITHDPGGADSPLLVILPEIRWNKETDNMTLDLTLSYDGRTGARSKCDKEEFYPETDYGGFDDSTRYVFAPGETKGFIHHLERGVSTLLGSVKLEEHCR